MREKLALHKGDRVKAFHPRMFGVVKCGVVDTVGTKWIRIDVGPLAGGLHRVPRGHVVDIEEAA